MRMGLLTKQVFAVGPASCGGCAVLCFREKLGSSIPKAIEPKFEELRHLLARADLAFRGGKIQSAGDAKDMALAVAAEILKGAREGEIPNFVRALESMVRNHAGSEESYRFLSG